MTDTWHPLFRGVVDEYGYGIPGSQVKEDVVLQCVDALDYLANFEMAPGLAGDPALGDPGFVTFGATDATGKVQMRIMQALANANWPAALTSIFTGNVTLQESVYSAGESILTVCHDAADAEFPTVANFFVDRYGFIVFHGRQARFDPDTVSASATHWDFHRWSAGDGAAIALDSNRAQIRPPYSFSRSRKMVRNAALCYPMGIDNADMPNQVDVNQASIDQHGTHTWSATDLLVLAPVTSGWTTANEETAAFATYIVDNYGNPQTRLSQVTFKSLRPDDPRAAATWELICNVDISDIINISVTHPGGGGITDDFYVEGVSYVLTPLEKDLDLGYPAVTLTLDLSPTTYWTDPGDLLG